MSIWDTLFGRHPSTTPPGPEPHHRFGRYTDAYKSKAKHAAYTRAADAFEDDRFLDSVEAFLEYLRDEEEENVKWQREADKLYFELYQGSKRVTGLADTLHLRAAARIARLSHPNGELLQRLTAMNYELKYSRFALDEEDCLTIIFDTPVYDASPYKLYYALKEMALRADKQDDLLLEEFEDALSPVEVTHLEPLSAHEKAVKLDFLRQHIQSLLDYLDSGQLDPREHPGAVAYLLLDLVYRLDYLLTPEGHTMEALERMHRMYFAQEDDRPATHKNVRLAGGTAATAGSGHPEELRRGALRRQVHLRYHPAREPRPPRHPDQQRAFEPGLVPGQRLPRGGPRYPRLHRWLRPV